MTIAIHISVARHEHLSDNFNFLCFSALALTQPHSHFIFIFDSAPDPETYLEPNCTPVILLPTLKNALLRHYWYNYKLPSIIQKYNADVCITDTLSCSFRLATAQCMIVRKEHFNYAERSVYFRKFLPLMLKKAAHIFTLDPGSLETLQKTHGISSKVSLLFPGLKNDAKPSTYEEREAVKDEFTSGNEYFLHITSSSDSGNVKVLLKAFSIFKKWQKSSMRIVLLVNTKLADVLAKELLMYKHRQDVLVVTEKKMAEKLIPGAYTLLLDKENLLTAAVPAMRCGVPVIINSDQNLKKMLPAVIETIWQEKNISENMMTLYKDESARGEIAERGFENSLRYSWKKTSEEIWEVLTHLKETQTA